MSSHEVTLIEKAILKNRKNMARAIAEYKAEERRLLRLRDQYDLRGDGKGGDA